MIGELGQFALCLALILSFVQAGAGLIGASRGDVRVMAMSRSCAIGVFVFVALSFAALTWAYVISDFSLAIVATNSHTAKPLVYKISGVWANHEGSMLLWMLILTIYSAFIAATNAGGNALSARALAVQALVGIAFLLFILLTSNPFLRLDPPPFEGNGLNPLLQDPGLAFHPPLLYLGYVGLSATFAFAAAALIDKRNDAQWIRAARPFASASWIALTLGIAAGSWWAYYTLGWGGFWFWDPVENASLMPWLVATALFHSMMATEKTGAFKSWTLLLAVAGFSFSLIGTFLVRSGVLNSVHSFANDPERGVFILGILVVAIGAPLILFAIRAPKLDAGAPFEPVSRETGILLNNLLLTGACATVFIGTLYPLLLDALEGTKISVGPPYFTVTFVPIMAVLAIVLPFAPMLNWRRGDLKAATLRLRYAMMAACAVMVITAFVVSPRSALGLLAVLLGVWLILGSFTDLYRRAGSFSKIRALQASAFAVVIAHAGMGVLALGAAGATVWRSEAIQLMAPGDIMRIAGYELKFLGTTRIAGPNYTADRGTIALMEGNKEVVRLHPEKRAFPAEGQSTTVSSIRTNGVNDLYVVLGDPRENGAWVVRAYDNPMAPLIWIGALFMAIGGSLGMFARLRETRFSRVSLPAGAVETRA